MTDLVLSGLVKRRATLAGELEASQARSRQIHADLASLDAVIRQLDPNYPIASIQTKYVRTLAPEEFAGMGRTVLDALRQAIQPLSIPDIASRVIVLRGMDAGSGAVRRAVEDGVARALRHQRKGGLVRNAEKVGRLLRWELAS
ncbi:hypothetical protein JMJ56_22015 [Belnapia sp. T18]|uniref:Uncharacterized protein n=1 Tax=Belnapia arida TaxID=2804533 RepID=A0ABS1U7P5_9PROT|nr:hypothetical protein [Belnapia arida]MBL6080697.1 hypothetical protein [Belnapia arida]